jgi:hypothetical protein
MPLQTARTGSERGARAIQQWATGPYSTGQTATLRGTYLLREGFPGSTTNTSSSRCNETSKPSHLFIVAERKHHFALSESRLRSRHDECQQWRKGGAILCESQA